MLLDRVKQMLTEKFPEEKISCKTDERNIVTLQGECSDWNTLINIGHAAAAVEGLQSVLEYQLPLPDNGYMVGHLVDLA